MKIKQLTFTRFLAAISIVIFHYGGKSFPFNNDTIAFMFKGANVCVSYFFMLSGFVMMIAYGNRARVYGIYYLRDRFARIYPLFFLGILMVFFQQLRTKNVDIIGMFLNVFMVQAWIPAKALSFNTPGWSLSVELMFYLVYPFLFNKIFRRISFKNIYISIVLFWILSQVIFHVLSDIYRGNHFAEDFLSYNPLMHLNEFLIGNLAGFFFIEKMNHQKRNYDFLILVLVGFIILALKFPLGLKFHNGLLAIFFIPLILLISLNDGFITKMFEKSPLIFLGEISFGIYILQHPIYSLISAYSVNKYFHLSDPTIVFFLRLIILIIVSSITYIYIEKPIQKKIKTKNKASFLENPA